MEDELWSCAASCQAKAQFTGLLFHSYLLGLNHFFLPQHSTGCNTFSLTQDLRRALSKQVYIHSQTAERIVIGILRTTTDIYSSRCRKRASSVMKVPIHPHTPHCLLPSGLRWSNRSRTTRIRNSFYPRVIRLLNSDSPL